MLPSVNRRTPFVRVLAILWATLQLASPAVSAIADGKAAFESASEATTHVEATSTERCPLVHAPDCGVCRYLSTPTSEQPAAPAWLATSSCARIPAGSDRAAPGAAMTLPRGRAPPAV